MIDFKTGINGNDVAVLRCDVMLENGLQCNNNAWAYMGPIPKCRLHFAIDLASTNDHVPEGKVLLEQDQDDLDRMLQVKRDRLYPPQKQDEER